MHVASTGNNGGNSSVVLDAALLVVVAVLWLYVHRSVKSSCADLNVTLLTALALALALVLLRLVQPEISPFAAGCSGAAAVPHTELRRSNTAVAVPLRVYNENATLLPLLRSDAKQALLKGSHDAAPEFPRAIYQTTQAEDRLPPKLALNFAKYAKGWQRSVFNDSAAIAFLNEHFQPQVAALFRTLNEGAHKADLFRYAILYTLGGVYLDIKTELLAPLDWLFEDRGSVFLVNSNINPGSIYNGILAAPSHQPIFLDMLRFMLEQGQSSNYHYNIVKLYDLVAVHCEAALMWEPDRCLDTQTCTFDSMRIRIAQEEQRPAAQCADGVDRYKLCAFITEKCEKIFKERYSDYPW